jgi:hypothetical protein
MILLRLVFLRSRLEFEHFLPTGLGVSAFAKGLEVYHLGMSRMRPEFLDPDHSRAVDALILEEPEDEEGEDERNTKASKMKTGTRATRSSGIESLNADTWDHTFNFQYPLNGALWTFCSVNRRFSAVATASGRLRSCSAKSRSLTITSPVGYRW